MVTDEHDERGVKTLLYDDIVVGTVYQSRAQAMDKTAIMEFANQYDPQYLHIDEEKAANSMYGGLIASGLHTLAVTFRLWVELDVFGEDLISGQGLDRVRFLRPVYPGDTLSVVIEVTDKKRHRLKPEHGFFKLRLTTVNQHEQKVLDTELTGIVKRVR